jgi:hypothetical protein
MRRRHFLQAVGGAALAPVTATRAQDETRKRVAIQLDAVGLVDEGIEHVLDEVQERASVNTLLLDVFWFSRATTESALTGERHRGHGPRAGDPSLRGAHLGTVHPAYYRDTGLDPRDLAPPEPRGRDLLAELAPAARKRGIRVFGLIKDFFPDRLPGVERLVERDFNGQAATTSCKRNPYYRQLLRGAVQDLIRSYDVDGIMYMAERQGAFTDTLGLRFRGVARGRPGSRTCFCEFCQAKASAQGTSYLRAKQAFEELERFVEAARAGRRPRDGHYVTLWRLMLRFPELLAWEHMWHEGLRELYQLLHAEVKAIRPSVLFGSHIWPNHYMSPILRAEQDIAALTPYHDFIKVALYDNCGGPRFASYIESVSQTMWGDVPKDELLQLHYRLMNYDEAPYPRVRETGLKRDFVFRESKRAMEGARGSRTSILSGIDVDIPVLALDLGPAKPSQVARRTRRDVSEAVRQAFQAGVDGIVVSREYTEMQLENLSGVGDAIRELGLRT